MYKPQPKQQKPEESTRQKLPAEEGCPSMAKARFMLDEATNRRGCLIELPWSAGSAEFTVTCQWDKTVQEPVWTLYQHEDDISKVVWTQGFAPSDLEFMYDILVMSAPKGTSQAKIPDLLKPQESSLPNPGDLPPGPGSVGSSSSSSSSSQNTSQGMSNQNISGNKAPLPQPNIGSPPGLGVGGSLGMPPGLAPGLGTGLGGGLSPGLGGGPASMPQQAPAQMPPQIPGQFPPQGYPQPGYPQPPMPGYPAGYPAPGMPYPPQGFPPPGYGAPMPGQPYMPPQGYPMNPMPGQMPPNPYGGNTNMPMGGPSSSAMPMTDPSSMDAKPIVPMDYQLLDKRPNLLIGVLLKDAGLITEPALDAALKIQELIREGKVSPQKAPLILQKHHSKGAKIEQFLSIDDVVVSKKAPEPAAQAPKSAQGGPTTNKGAAPAPAGNKAGAPASAQAAGQAPAGAAKGAEGPGGAKRNLKPAFDLLQKAGILTESDVKDALDVRQKIGGDLVSILESAGKLNKKTVDAAFVCLPLIREGLMKTEQCIIALNYCSRMRVGFDEALDEMGWQNPRKLRTDLPLY
ncbi:MAG: hypothetical protein SFY67_00005 [Candidatus Melainabacteria bacterium]|nr:hypothetical protein [Candidatus Melainabacteria bacterium]